MEDKILESRKPLMDIDLSKVNKRYHRVISFDPTEVYRRIDSLIKPNKRTQFVPMDRLFPIIEGNTCDCGCGKELTGRRKRWASDECRRFVEHVYFVITGKSNVIGNILYAIYGWKCCECNRDSMDINRPNEKDVRTSIEIEHTLPVKHGGGGSWLSNYKLMCFECHRHKTNKDFGFKIK